MQGDAGVVAVVRVVEPIAAQRRTVGATEVLLVRAKRAFRAEYERRTGEEER